MLEYEEFIKKELKKDLSPTELTSLQAYHREMMANFQHERLIHLIVTLFFSLLTIGVIIAVGFVASIHGFSLEVLPIYLMTAILVILTFFYVKHYYFLENHTQRLYKYSELLYKNQ